MGTLNRTEMDEFLSQPRTAQLVTLRAAGTPHVAPVWFLWDEGRALVMADRGAVKVRNIRRNPAVALCVSTPGHPYVFVTIEGTANIADTGLEDMVRRTCVLYEADERGTAFAEELLADERLTLISITPDRFISWKRRTRSSCHPAHPHRSRMGRHKGCPFAVISAIISRQSRS